MEVNSFIKQHLQQSPYGHIPGPFSKFGKFLLTDPTACPRGRTSLLRFIDNIFFRVHLVFEPTACQHEWTHNLKKPSQLQDSLVYIIFWSHISFFDHDTGFINQTKVSFVFQGVVVPSGDESAEERRGFGGANDSLKVLVREC